MHSTVRQEHPPFIQRENAVNLLPLNYSHFVTFSNNLNLYKALGIWDSRSGDGGETSLLETYTVLTGKVTDVSKNCRAFVFRQVAHVTYVENKSSAFIRRVGNYLPVHTE